MRFILWMIEPLSLSLSLMGERPALGGVSSAVRARQRLRKLLPLLLSPHDLIVHIHQAAAEAVVVHAACCCDFLTPARRRRAGYPNKLSSSYSFALLRCLHRRRLANLLM